jgi:hypothetical protein
VKPVMYDREAVKALIQSGRKLLLAGDESLLSVLPKGTWIGGTIPYFMAEEGGVQTKDRIYVTELPEHVKKIEVREYDERSIANVYTDMPANGVSFILIPALTKTHLAFALNAPTYPGFASQPLVGWITGVDLADFGKLPPRIFNGVTGKNLAEGAVVMHLTLPDNLSAELDIVNLFVQGHGDSIRFSEDGFSAKQAIINGVSQPFARYLKEKNVDTRLPLVADFGGAMINTSFQGVDESTQTVSFYAPVFAGMEYRLGTTEGDYVSSFGKRLSQKQEKDLLFSCNCILNYLYAGLEGKRTGGVTGPVTFGEIAYQLLNQTMVYVKLANR